MPLADKYPDNLTLCIVMSEGRIRRQSLQVLVIHQSQVGANVETQAQLINDDANHALEKHLGVRRIVDSSLMTTGAGAPTVGQSNVIASYWHATHVAAGSRLVALAADDDEFVIFGIVKCIDPAA